MDNMYLIRSARHERGYLFPSDNVLDGFTLNNVIFALHNEKGPLTKEKLHEVVKNMLEINVQDLWAIINENDEEIIEAAYEGRSDNPKKAPCFDVDWADKAEALAKDIYKWCIAHDCWQDVCIYYNGKRMRPRMYDKNGNVTYAYRNGVKVFACDGCYEVKPLIEDGYDPRDYFEYVREPNILSMSYEGPLYEILNNDDLFALEDLFKKYGLYYENGEAWNLSAYPIDD